MMNTNSLSSNSPSFTILTKHSLPSYSHKRLFSLPQRHGSLRFNPIICTSSINNNNNGDNDADSVQTQTPDAEVGVRFRRRSSRRQSRLKQKEINNGDVVSSGSSMQSTRTKASESPKKWEDMSLSEKAIELYVGEKGALYWLNKFAYASIFIMIGAWIVFRFVGPALNLYQLDSPPLSPSDVLKGSS